MTIAPTVAPPRGVLLGFFRWFSQPFVARPAARVTPCEVCDEPTPDGGICLICTAL